MSEPVPHEKPSGAILTSRTEFQDAIRQAFKLAADQGCREIFISDTDFAHWPLSERAVIDDLTRWAFAHRKLTVLAQHYDEFPRRHARWAEWRRQWAHVVECRALADIEPGEIPGIFLAPGVTTLRLLDPVRFRASVSYDEADAIRTRDALDAVLQRSEEAFPATTLGL